MTHVCRQCSRVNPAEASYCYWDGAILEGNKSAAGPVNVGSAPFPSQFVFPSGQVCRNFDQLATTCQQNWKAAADLLKQGFLGSFLGGLGRADLAMAAQEAAKFPDIDRGLDELLAKLPTQVLQKPQLKVEPSEVNLGRLAMGTDRKMDLHLSNLGMRLLYGTVASDCKWLTLGDGQGSAQKLFQFGADSVIPIHVKGQFLRAGNQPLEGNLVVSSNGGDVTVKIRADVPITPFSEGVLANSTTPRQIAEKARKFPKEAAALFEKGLVAQWFGKNGWTYPVQGPTMAGPCGVQQFFEALGLAKPPKVDLKTPSLQLRGSPGQVLTANIDLGTSEKKLVYGFGTSDQHWCIPGMPPRGTKPSTSYSVPLTINVPGAPGQTLQAKVVLTANGGRKFTVPLSLAVNGRPGDPVPASAVPVAVTPAMAGAAPVMATPIMATPIMATPMPVTPLPGSIPAASPFAFNAGPAPMAAAPMAATPMAPAPMPLAPMPSAVSAQPMPAAMPVPMLAPAPFSTSGGDEQLIDTSRLRKRGSGAFVHFIPFGILLLLLVGVMIRDLFGNAPGGGSGNVVEVGEVDYEKPRIAIYLDHAPQPAKGIGNTLSWGAIAVDPAKPLDPNPQRLTFDHRGRTNSTVLRIDNVDKVLGVDSWGKWVDRVVTPENAKALGMTQKAQSSSAKWQFAPEPIYVTQTVEVVPGEVDQVTNKRYLNIALVRYKVENKDARSHTIGLRAMVDTLIGQNDGVPFMIPGQGMISTFKDFRQRAEIPDFLQALEYPNLDAPGTIVQMNLKLSDKLAPDRVSLTHWPGHKAYSWEVNMETIREDSCIVLYWNPVEMKPGETRDMAFSYGLGKVSGGKLGLTVGGTFAVGREMTVVAYVAEPKVGETAELKLPPDFTLLPGLPAKQPVPAAEKGPDGKMRPSPVTWRISPTTRGVHTIEVETSTGLKATQKVTIGSKGIF